MDLRDRLIAFLKEQGIPVGESDAKADQSLIRSGVLDSLALFHLVLWVEREAGRPYDVTAVDLPREWDTVSGIVEFVESLKAGRADLNVGAAQAGRLDHEWDTKS